jgi:hypothetical protein
MGGIEWMSAMQWPFQNSFNKATQQNFTLNSDSVGWFKQANNATFMFLDDCGHMVPVSTFFFVFFLQTQHKNKYTNKQKQTTNKYNKIR